MTTDDPGDDGAVRFREEQTGFLSVGLVTEVRTDGVYVRFRPLHASFRRFGWAEIADATVATYSAREYGGWGWGVRLSPTGSAVAYRISGDRGVRLTLDDGKRVFVGSSRPEELLASVQAARDAD